MSSNPDTPRDWWPDLLQLINTGLDADQRGGSGVDAGTELTYLRGMMLGYATYLLSSAKNKNSVADDKEVIWWRSRGADMAKALADLAADQTVGTVAAMDTKIDEIQATYDAATTAPSGTRGVAATTSDTDAVTLKIGAAETAISTAQSSVSDPDTFFQKFLAKEKDDVVAHLAVYTTGLDPAAEIVFRQKYAFDLADRLYARGKVGIVEMDSENVYWFKTQALNEAARLFTVVASGQITTPAGWVSVLTTAKTNLGNAATNVGFTATATTAASVRATAIANSIANIDDKQRAAAVSAMNSAQPHAALVARLTAFQQDWATLQLAQFSSDTVKVTAWKNQATQDATELIRAIGSAQSSNSAEMIWWQFRAATIVRALVNQLKVAMSDPVTTEQKSGWETAITNWRKKLFDSSSSTGTGWLQTGYVPDASETVAQLTSTLSTLQSDITALGSSSSSSSGGGGGGGGGGGTCDEELAKIRAKEEADAKTADRKRTFEQSAAERRAAERSVWRMLAFGGVALFLCALGAFLFGILAFWTAMAVLVTMGFGYAALDRYQKIRDRDPGAFGQVNPDKLDQSPKPTPHVEEDTGGSSSFTSGGGGGKGAAAVQSFFSGGEGYRSTTARTSGATLAQLVDAKRRRVTRPAVMAMPRQHTPPPVVSSAGFRASSTSDDVCGCATTTVGNTRKTWIGDGW